MNRCVRAYCLVLLCLSLSTPVCGETLVIGEKIRVRKLKEMEYPLAARLKAQQGVVVIRVILDDSGRVVETEPIVGPSAFIAAVAANSKEWQFEPSELRRAVLIYDFRIEDTCQLPCKSQFLFRPPNVVVIRIGSPLVN